MKHLALLFTIPMLWVHGTFAQCLYDDEPDLTSTTAVSASSLWETSNGRRLPVRGDLRVLIALIEVAYSDPLIDPTGPSGTTQWPSGQLPVWVNNTDPGENLIDAQIAPEGPKGQITRYFHDASSGSFRVTGDYLLGPVNGLFSIPSTWGNISNTEIRDAINNSLGQNIVTLNGLNSIDFFDNWSEIGGSSNDGLPKTSPSTENPRKYDHMVIIIRNARGAPGTDPNTGLQIPGGAIFDSGSAHSGTFFTLVGFESNTYCKFYTQGRIPANIMRHEMAHLFIGDNRFHCAGGGNGESGLYWIGHSNGWGMLGLSGSSLLTWNAWDRLQLGWKQQDQTYAISARDADNLNEVNGDLNSLDPNDAGIYVLRDFVGTGDALRISLPFIDSGKFPQWIWIENHQGSNANGNPFDRFQYEGADCVESVVPGLFMYIQIDRENRISQTSSGSLYNSGYEEYSRPLSASGNYDMLWVTNNQPGACIGWSGEDVIAFVRAVENPLTGMGDTYLARGDGFPLGVGGLVGNGQINSAERWPHVTEFDPLTNQYMRHNFINGHSRQAFNLNGNRKLGIGTNPSSASLMNRSGDNTDYFLTKDNRSVALNGVSIEILQQLSDGSIVVRVRFDDVDMESDARWCADEIKLSPINTTSGYSLNIKNSSSLILDQGFTSTRRSNPAVFAGQSVFASPTVMRCLDQSWLNVDENSSVVVDNGSTLVLEDGARMDLKAGSELRVLRGGKLELRSGATLNVADGALVYIEQGADEEPEQDGRLVYHPNARINLEGENAELRIAGQLDILDDASFTLGHSADPNWTRGKLRFTNSRSYPENVNATPTSRFVIRSNDKWHRVLYVEQAVLDFDELAGFELEKVTAALMPESTIVPAISVDCVVRVADARITSLQEAQENGHFGLTLYGQPQTELVNSAFSYGKYGLLALNFLGSGPRPEGCSFSRNYVGFYNVFKGFKATNCEFISNEVGLKAEQVALGSFLVGCQALNNTIGVEAQGASTLMVDDPLFTGNHQGLVIHQLDTRIDCGSISGNSAAGVHVMDGGILRMDGTKDLPHRPVTMVGNGITIKLSEARNLYLASGHNNLTPLSVGQQNVLHGTVVCSTSGVQNASKNIWNGSNSSPIANTDYLVTRSCGVFPPPSLVFYDPFGTVASTCGQAAPPCPDPPCHIVGLPAQMACADCATVETELHGTIPLNEASEEALSMALADNVQNNEKLALSGLTEILTSDIGTPSQAEKAILDYDYYELRSAHSEAIRKGQVAPSDSSAVDSLLTVVIGIQEQRSLTADANLDAHEKLFLSLDQAQASRISGKFISSIALLDNALTWAPAPTIPLLERVRCLTELEEQLQGITTPVHVGDPEMLCNGGGLKALVIAPEVDAAGERSVALTSIHPNPSTGFVDVIGFAGEGNSMQIHDAQGRLVFAHTFNERESLSLPLKFGVYTYRILGSNGRVEVGRLVITQ